MTDWDRGRLLAVPLGRGDRRLPEEEVRAPGRVMTVLDDPGAPDVLDMWRSVDDVDVDVDVPADSRFAVLVRPGRVLGLDLVREVGHRRQVTS